jgi:hypothetical protein
MLILLPALLIAAAATPLLDAAETELQAFHRQEALDLLQRARAATPLSYDENVRLHEELGIAYAYLNREADAVAAFDMLLALKPGHALRYTLSPKVTFPFELARHESDQRPPPELRVTWPLGSKVSEPLPVTLEVVADPKSFMRQARVYSRLQGDASYAATTVELAPKGAYRNIALPPRPATSAEVMELYTVAVDASGNEVLELGSATKPYAIALTYEAAPAWYQHWWVWAVAGVVAAGASAAIIYFDTRAPSRTVPADVTISH